MFGSFAVSRPSPPVRFVPFQRPATAAVGARVRTLATPSDASDAAQLSAGYAHERVPLFTPILSLRPTVELQGRELSCSVTGGDSPPTPMSNPASLARSIRSEEFTSERGQAREGSASPTQDCGLWANGSANGASDEDTQCLYDVHTEPSSAMNHVGLIANDVAWAPGFVQPASITLATTPSLWDMPAATTTTNPRQVGADCQRTDRVAIVVEDSEDEDEPPRRPKRRRRPLPPGSPQDPLDISSLQPHARPDNAPLLEGGDRSVLVFATDEEQMLAHDGFSDLDDSVDHVVHTPRPRVSPATAAPVRKRRRGRPRKQDGRVSWSQKSRTPAHHVCECSPSPEWEVEAVIDQRRTSSGQMLVLVEWKPTWELEGAVAVSASRALEEFRAQI